MTETRHYVMRTHSHTDRQCLWKVMSRGIRNKHDAECEMDWHAGLEKNPDHEFFIVTKEEALKEDNDEVVT